jgi:hypothetical protein
MSRKTTRTGQEIDSLNYETIDTAIQKLIELKERLESKGYTNLILNITTCGHESVDYVVDFDRPETDDEMNYRIEQERRAAQRAEHKAQLVLETKKLQEQAEREQYKKLKAKYGNT